jgi:hypothetical protein
MNTFTLYLAHAHLFLHTFPFFEHTIPLSFFLALLLTLGHSSNF